MSFPSPARLRSFLLNFHFHLHCFVENLKTKSPADPEGSAGLVIDRELISQ